VVDLLRGDFKQSEHGRVILPFTVLRRLDCVLARCLPLAIEQRSLPNQQQVIPDRRECAVAARHRRARGWGFAPTASVNLSRFSWRFAGRWSGGVSKRRGKR
jgi:hypothetical protein